MGRNIETRIRALESRRASTKARIDLQMDSVLGDRAFAAQVEAVLARADSEQIDDPEWALPDRSVPLPTDPAGIERIVFDYLRHRPAVRRYLSDRLAAAQTSTLVVN
jgi:hypothetical protein